MVSPQFSWTIPSPDLLFRRRQVYRQYIYQLMSDDRSLLNSVLRLSNFLALEVPSAGNPSSLSRTIINGHLRSAYSTIWHRQATLQIKVCQVVKELRRRISELKQDRQRLRKRSRRLMRRLIGTICAYWWWQVRVRRKLNVLDDGSRVYCFRNGACCSVTRPKRTDQASFDRTRLTMSSPIFLFTLLIYFPLLLYVLR
jgi:hypothetical protein